MAFRSEKHQQLLDTAKAYVAAWGQGMQGGKDEVRERFSKLMRDDLRVQPDGVLFKSGLEGLDNLLHSLAARHRAYHHVRYEPYVVAANEATNTVFALVEYELRNIGPLPYPEGASSEPTGKTSKGFAIKKLVMADDGRIQSLLTCRQLTEEEKAALLEDPAACTPTAIPLAALRKTQDSPEGATTGVTDGLGEHSAEEHKQMESIIKQWVSVWSTGTSVTNVLPMILDATAHVHDAYGLHGTNSGGEEGGVKFDFTNREEAEKAVTKVHAEFENVQELLGWAVADEHRVGFEHWKGRAVHRASKQEWPIEGLDLVVFTPELRIRGLVQFTMQHYAALKS